jgi:aconitate hydratase
MLPLWFKNSADYDKISGSDKLSIVGLNDFKVGGEITVEIKHQDGSKDSFQTTTSINEGQWEWFKHGSALNLMAKKAAEKAASA